MSNMACLLLSILSSNRVSTPESQDISQPRPAVDPDVLDTEAPLVLVTLDLLANTGTLDAQAQLDPLPQLGLGALGRKGQKLLDAVLPRHLDQLSLAAERVLGVVPPPGDGVLHGHKRVRDFFLVGRLERLGGGAGGQDRGRRVPRKEGAQPRWQRQR